MALQVPDRQLSDIRKLLELPDERTQELLRALADAGPNFNVDDLAAEVSTRTKLPRRLVNGIVSVLASLYITRDSHPVPLEAFVDEEVGVALRNVMGSPSDLVDTQWARLRKFLMVALALDNTVGTASKAGHVLTEHERIFDDARILTDIRPIFHLDVSDKPNAAVLIHMLRVRERDSLGRQSVHFFALDANDLRSLKEIIDRAIKKEETLRDAMKNSAINILEPREFF
jgi:uncharacterized protein (DUF1778 family)